MAGYAGAYSPLWYVAWPYGLKFSKMRAHDLNAFAVHRLIQNGRLSWMNLLACHPVTKVRRPLFESDVKSTYSHGRDLGVRVNAPQRAVLVFSQTNYPGWKATVDGQRVPVVPADIALIGVPVPAGIQDVRLTFEPASFKIGAVLTIVCLAIIG